MNKWRKVREERVGAGDDETLPGLVNWDISISDDMHIKKVEI